MESGKDLVWIAYLSTDDWAFVLCLLLTFVALFGCYANISFMCPLFRHRTEHLRVPSVRLIFHISLADCLFGAFTVVFLILYMIAGLNSSVQYFLFYLFPYLTFVVDAFVVLVALEQFSEVCSEDYDREIRIRDCKRQPLVVWFAPVAVIVGVLLTPYNPSGSIKEPALNYIFPVVVLVVFLATFGTTFIYIFVIRRMNLDLHHHGLMDQSRLRLLQRNRLILVHLVMTIVFLALQSVNVLFLIFYARQGMMHEEGWCLVAGSLALLNSAIKPIIYVLGTSFYRDVYVRKDCVTAGDDAERVEEGDG